jgi:hypothetical protein
MQLEDLQQMVNSHGHDMNAAQLASAFIRAAKLRPMPYKQQQEVLLGPTWAALSGQLAACKVSHSKRWRVVGGHAANCSATGHCSIVRLEGARAHGLPRMSQCVSDCLAAAAAAVRLRSPAAVQEEGVAARVQCQLHVCCVCCAAL